MRGRFLALLVGLVVGIAIAVRVTVLASSPSEHHMGASHRHIHKMMDSPTAEDFLARMHTSMGDGSEKMMELCSRHMAEHEGHRDMMGMMSMMGSMGH